MSKKPEVEFTSEDMNSLLKSYQIQLNGGKPLSSVETVRIRKDLSLDVRNFVSIVSFDDKEDIALIIGNKVVMLRNYKELKNLIGALGLLVEKAIDSDDLKKIAKRADKKHDFYYLNNLNIQEMNSQFTNQIADNKSIQEDITGESVQTKLLQRAAVPTLDADFKAELKKNVIKFYDLIQTVSVKQQEISESGIEITDELADLADYSNSVGIEISNLTKELDVRGINIIDAITNDTLSTLNSESLFKFSKKLSSVLTSIEDIDSKLTAVTTGVSPKKFVKYSANFTAEDIIAYTRDPKKGLNYAQEQLSRLPEDQRAAMLTEIENILNVSGN